MPLPANLETSETEGKSVLDRLVRLEELMKRFQTNYKDLDAHTDTLENKMNVVLRDIDTIQDNLTRKASLEFARKVEAR